MAEENNHSDGSDQQLSRRERRKLLREEKKQGNMDESSKFQFKKWVIIGIVSLLVAWGIWSIAQRASEPLPGSAIEDLGQEHVIDISNVNYNSNPPTSGPHFAVWAKPGIYDRLISDGHLIHSMEHGYIIIWYDCTKSMTNAKLPMINEVLAQEGSAPSAKPLTQLKVKPEGTMSWFTTENPPPIEVDLPEEFKSEDCKNKVNDLSKYTKVAKRVIVAPRLNMDAPIVLTAWNRIDKLANIDEARIKNFIKAYHNRGPEKTDE